MAKNKKIIPMACDHAGYELKKKIKEYLESKGFEIKDFGTYSEESCDYPDYAHQVGNAINKGEYEKGIVICGSGNGVQMTVNKYPHVRCALCWIPEISHLARQHNDANILSMPARFISEELAIQIVEEFLNTPFEGGRHQRRVEKINKLIQ
jgi:ribose 5-phosphate isomerase B